MATEQTSIIPYGAAELRTRVENLRIAVMKEGIDYGTIPGSDKKALMKPGAEKLCSEFGFYPRFEQVTAIEEFNSAMPLFHYRYRAVLYRATGEPIAEGIGSCNSMEKKYRYRQADRVCPQCGKSTIIKGKAEFGGGWVCFAKKGGCGAKFKDNDTEITAQQAGQIDNPDIFDQINTIDKMAQKRALVAAVLIATNASEYFTQDLEDFSDVVDGTFQEMPVERPQSSQNSPNSRNTPPQRANTSNGAKNGQNAANPPDGTIDHVLLKEVRVYVKEPETKHRYEFLTEDNRKVYEFSRDKFKEFGWIEDHEWQDLGTYTIKHPIPAAVKFNATDMGGWWNIDTVAEVEF